jgi:predicted ATPase/DNA-binding SARP family transcriptional activator
MNPLCRIDLLGGLRVHQDDRVITRFQTQKTAALLAYIALHKGRAFPREFIAELLWPDGDPTAIRNRLNQAVSSLRRQLHPPGSEPGYVIDADHAKIAINDRTVVTDVENFQAAIKRAGDAEDEEAELAALNEAIDYYCGDFLEGYYEEWALLERVRLADQYTHALSRIIRINADRGRITEAIDAAGKRLSLDPLEERNHRALMRLYVMAGRPQSALLQFEELDRALAADGRTPSPKALKLLESAKEAAATGPVDQPLSLEPATAEVEVETETDEPDECRPRPRKAAVEPTTTLPLYVTNFVGREAELAQVVDAVRAGQRLVTLTGLGGIGKTRLAVEAAWALAADFTEQVVFVGLQGLHRFEEVYPQLTRAVRRVFGFNPNIEEEITEEVPKIGRLLMIVDNVEMVDDETIGWFNDRLGRYHQMSVVMTSRSPLGLDGELVIPLGPLPLPKMEATTTLQELAENPTVRLFVSRARTARHDFQITERTANSIVQLCRRLEGWPLALELAAGWSRTLTPAQMVDQVSEQYDRLASRRRDIAERHRSISAVLDGSFRILEEEYRAPLLRMVVFEASFEHEAAEHVCPGLDLLAILQELEERNWITSRFSDGRMRFSMLETIRAYLNQQVSPSIRIECGWLHAEYFAGLVAATSALPREEWGGLVPDHPNIKAAFDFFLEQGAALDALKLLVGFAPMLGAYGGTNEAVSSFERMESKFDELAEKSWELVAHAKAVYGRKLLLLSELDRAEGFLQAAVKDFADHGATEDSMAVRIDLANIAHSRAQYADSIAMFREIEEDAVKQDLLVLASRAANGQGNSYLNLGDQEKAGPPLERALSFARRSGNLMRLCTVLQSIANLELRRGESAQARAHIEESIELSERIGDRVLWFHAQLGMVDVDRATENWQFAASRLYMMIRMAINLDPIIAAQLIQAIFILHHFGLEAQAAQIYGSLKDDPIGARFWTEECLTERDAVMAEVERALGSDFEREFHAGSSLTLRAARELASTQLKSLLDPV